MRENDSVHVRPPSRDPRHELVGERLRQAGVGVILVLVPVGIFAMAKLLGPPTGPLERTFVVLTVSGSLIPGMTFLMSGLMSHVQGAEPRLSRDALRRGLIFSSEGWIASDVVEASPRLAALIGDMSARRRRLRVRVDLLPDHMVIASRPRGTSNGSAPTVTVGLPELLSTEVVWLIIGSGLGARMQDGTAFALALPVSGSTLTRKLTRWRDTPTPPSSS